VNSLSPALATMAPSLRGEVLIVLGELMPVLAVRGGALLGDSSGYGSVRRASVSMMFWRHHVLEAQASFSTLTNRVALQIGGSIRKLRQSIRHTFYAKDDRPSLIALLLFARCPPTVLRRIGAVVVDPVKCQTVRSWPHVSHESSKGVSPLRAHCDTTSTVVSELLCGRCVAAAKHALPHGIQGWDFFKRHASR
jgi:hypothetical protein